MFLTCLSIYSTWCPTNIFQKVLLVHPSWGKIYLNTKLHLHYTIVFKDILIFLTGQYVINSTLYLLSWIVVNKQKVLRLLKVTNTNFEQFSFNWSRNMNEIRCKIYSSLKLNYFYNYKKSNRFIKQKYHIIISQHYYRTRKE